jgi:hypothetical protein
MKTKPARLDATQTLEEIANSGALRGFDADDLLFVECEKGWFALLTAGALQQWVATLHSALNRWLATAMLTAPLGELLRPIAKQSDAPPAGPSRRPPINSADALLRALGVDPEDLNTRGQSAKPPDHAAEALPDDDAKSVDPLEVPAGKGGREDDAGGGSKGGLSNAETAESEPPAPPMLQREEIRLDVVTPETAVVDEPFDMAVAIRQPASPALSIDDLPKLTSTPGEVYRSAGQDLIKYRVEVEVDDCAVKPARYDFLLAKGRDSIVQYFQLTPKRAGNLSIVVNAYQADSAVLAATTRVRLKAGVAVAGDARSTQMEADMVRVYDVLTSLFSLSDVEDLATRLSINWDELAGDTLSAKCRALLAYCSNRGKYDPLRQLVKAARPQAGL